jgi:hypothetical protein
MNPPAMAWRRAVSCWRTSAWRCSNSRFRRTPTALENFIHPLPICADELPHPREPAALRGRYEMVNIKLDKTGGLTEALALARSRGAGV